MNVQMRLAGIAGDPHPSGGLPGSEGIACLNQNTIFHYMGDEHLDTVTLDDHPIAG